MSISSSPVAKFQFPWAREEERDPRDQKQIVALTAALQANPGHGIRGEDRAR